MDFDFDLSPDKLVNGNYLQYADAEKYLHSLNFKSIKDYKKWLCYKAYEGELYINDNGVECPLRPTWICSNPCLTYKKTMPSLTQYVLNKKPKPKRGKTRPNGYRLYTIDQATIYLIKYKFANGNDYKMWVRHSAKQKPGDPDYVNNNGFIVPKKPSFIPFDPEQAYHTTFINYNIYLHGPKFREKYFVKPKVRSHPERVYYTYDNAKKFLKKLNFKSPDDYLNWIYHNKYFRTSDKLYTNLNGVVCPKQPAFIPRNPKFVYWRKFVNLIDYLSLPEEKFQKYLKYINSNKGGNILDNVNFKIYDYERAKELVSHIPDLTTEVSYARFYKQYADVSYRSPDGKVLPPLRGILPYRVKHYYMHKGSWVSWDDFLSREVKPIDPNLIQFLFNMPANKRFIDPSQWKIEARKYGVNPADLIHKLYTNGKWIGWDKFLYKQNNKYCTYEEAKILLSYKNFETPSEYYRWKRNNDAFFLPRPVIVPTLYADDNGTIEDMLCLNLATKLEYQAKSKPVANVKFLPDNSVSINIVKAGKFEAYLRYNDEDKSYIFDTHDIDLFNDIVKNHCYLEKGKYKPYNVSQFYNELAVTFKVIIYATLFD